MQITLNQLVSESATKRMQDNARQVFGSKSVSILKALEEASKEKALNTPGLDAFLSAFKLKATEFEKVSAKASFDKAVKSAKSFATAKTFSAKIAALKAIKFVPAKVPGEVVPAYKQKALKGPETGKPVAPAAKTKSLDYDDVRELLIQVMEDTNDDTGSKMYAAFKSIFGFKPPAGTRVGFGASSDDTGIYYIGKNENFNVVMCENPGELSLQVGLTPVRGAYLAYKDTYANEGPFLGEANPVKGTAKMQTSFDKAKAHFIKLAQASK